MQNFLEAIFAQLRHADARVVLREIRGQRFVSGTGKELFEQIQQVRAFLRTVGMQPGNRCALLAANSIRWLVFDLALMAEGVIVVPLYVRQSPGELANMMKDCQARLLLVSDAALGEAVRQVWPEAPRQVVFDEVLKPGAPNRPLTEWPHSRSDSDLITIIYTSGTSGEPKGVCLNTGNLNFMLARTTERLEQLMALSGNASPDRVFHYLPFNFAASWLLLLSCLTRETTLTLSTDLNRLAEEIRLASPNYFLNVPTLLERVRRAVEEGLAKRRGPLRWLFQQGRAAWQQKARGPIGGLGELSLWAARKLIFDNVRRRFGRDLRALICGSAPLAPETQQFFQMLGIPVLQAYGLTETTGICTMDDPRIPAEPGYVGQAISGTELSVGENQEIVARGPHIFPGYWNRSEETARALEDGWFHTGDQGQVNARGHWRIIGRVKNLIVLNSGHKVAPEPMEEHVSRLLPLAEQVVVLGNGRSYLAVLITGPVESVAVQAALTRVNMELPHYRQIRNFQILREPLTAENGLLTAMGKLRRDAIQARYACEINAMYEAPARLEKADTGEETRAVNRQHA